MDVILAKPFVLDLVLGSLKGWKRKCGGSWASGKDFKLMNGLRILIAVMKLRSGSGQPQSKSGSPKGQDRCSVGREGVKVQSEYERTSNCGGEQWLKKICKLFRKGMV